MPKYFSCSVKHYFLLMATLVLVLPIPSTASEDDMFDMELTSLMEMEITSAGRKSQNSFDVPAAVYVIDQNKLQRSGVTTIADALRLVPGLHVGQSHSNRWAIGSRGFNGHFSNKLLVQIDGRSVYTPSYSGVYWSTQNVVLEDIERIEVIRGPGATLWGANAVNGIINIITKKASETQGTLMSIGTGNHEKFMGTVRYGTKLNENSHGRFYATHHDRSAFKFSNTDSEAHDAWAISSAGFRLDGKAGSEKNWSLQGNGYVGENEQQVEGLWLPGLSYPIPYADEIDTKGVNINGTWEHILSDTGSWIVQAYYDYTSRDEVFTNEAIHHTLNLDFQHRFQWKTDHDIVWGLGYRLIKDDFGSTFQTSFTPDSQTYNLVSAFFQDEMALKNDEFRLIVGAKLEYNDYTHMEIQPNLRLLWKPDETQRVWIAVSHAVRTPARMERTGTITIAFIPTPFGTQHLTLDGSSGFDSEKMIAWESGYRYAPTSTFSFDAALFYNDYWDLMVTLPKDDFSGNYYFSNSMEGYSYGVELSSEWHPNEWLETELNYSYINMNMDRDGYEQKLIEESAPTHQISLRVGFNILKTLQLNLWGRYTDEIKFAQFDESEASQSIDAYVGLDANLKWYPMENVEVTLVGQNLLDREHIEFITDANISTVEVERSFYTKLTWKF